MVCMAPAVELGSQLTRRGAPAAQRAAGRPTHLGLAPGRLVQRAPWRVRYPVLMKALVRGCKRSMRVKQA
jgi:hypothetical protein